MAEKVSPGSKFTDLSELLKGVGAIVPRPQTFSKKTKSLRSPKTETVDVCLFTEGTYPFVRGGVSTVIHQIIEAHPHLTFGIVFIGWDYRDDLASKYPALSQIKWTKTIFLNQRKKETTNFLPSFTNTALNLKVAKELFEAMEELKIGSTKGFEKIYFKYLNPATRKTNLKDVVGSSTFLELLLSMYQDRSMTLNDLFWLQKELIHIFNNLTDTEYPVAKVYHSHTQGYAGFAASLAALQNQGAFFLTEHSLYLRDVKNALDEDFSTRKQKYAKRRMDMTGLDLKKKTWQGWFELIGTWTYHQASSISYLYPRIAKEAQKLGAPASVSNIIPNGINFGDFEQARQKQILRANKRHQKDHVWTISLIGRIVPVKGILDMIEAAKYMKENWQTPFKIELVGPTDEDMSYFKACSDKIEQYKLKDYIDFTGPKKVTEYLGQTDLIVLSSHSEALPMAALEGMASGIPVVSTEVGSVPDIIHNSLGAEKIGPCGLMSKPQAPHELAKQIINMLSNKELYLSSSENAPKRAQTGYNLEKVMNSYGKIYRVLSINLSQGEVEYFQ